MLSLMSASEAVLLLASLSDVSQSVVAGELSAAERERLMLVSHSGGSLCCLMQLVWDAEGNSFCDQRLKVLKTANKTAESEQAMKQKKNGKKAPKSKSKNKRGKSIICALELIRSQNSILSPCAVSLNNPVKEELAAAFDLATDRALVEGDGDSEADIITQAAAELSGAVSGRISVASMRQAGSSRLAGGSSALPPSGPRRGAAGPRGQRMSIAGEGGATTSEVLNRMSSDGRAADVGTEGEDGGFLSRADGSRDGRTRMQRTRRRRRREACWAEERPSPALPLGGGGGGIVYWARRVAVRQGQGRTMPARLASAMQSRAPSKQHQLGPRRSGRPRTGSRPQRTRPRRTRLGTWR